MLAYIRKEHGLKIGLRQLWEDELVKSIGLKFWKPGINTMFKIGWAMVK